MSEDAFALQQYAKAVIAAVSKPTLCEEGRIAMQPEAREAEEDRANDYSPIETRTFARPKRSRAIDFSKPLPPAGKHELASKMRRFSDAYEGRPDRVRRMMDLIDKAPGDLTEEDTAFLKAKGWME